MRRRTPSAPSATGLRRRRNRQKGKAICEESTTERGERNNTSTIPPKGQRFQVSNLISRCRFHSRLGEGVKDRKEDKIEKIEEQRALCTFQKRQRTAKPDRARLSLKRQRTSSDSTDQRTFTMTPLSSGWLTAIIRNGPSISL